MVKMVFTDNQTAFEYAMYMIAASYFGKAKCLSWLQERKMRVQYLEQKVNNQYKMEEICIAQMDKLIEKLPFNPATQEVEVKLIHHPKQNITEIRFANAEFTLSLTGTYKGRGTRIKHRIAFRKAVPVTELQIKSHESAA